MVQAMLIKGFGAVHSLKHSTQLLGTNKYAQYAAAQFSSKTNGLRIALGVSSTNNFK